MKEYFGYYFQSVKSFLIRHQISMQILDNEKF